jgi:RNA polymerase sigma-70 factor (sigma-E family)
VFVPTDAAGFREFVDAHSRDLLRMAWLLTGDWGRGEDLVQAALLRCWPKWSTIEVPQAYVQAAMLNVFLSWRRRRWTDEQASDRLPETAAPDALGAVEVRTAVRSALLALSPRERAVIVLRFYTDLSEAETARVLDIAVGTVKRYASDALARLRADPALAGLLTEEVPR